MSKIGGGRLVGRGLCDITGASTLQAVQLARRLLVQRCFACASELVLSLLPMSESPPSLALVGFDEDLKYYWPC